MPLRVKISTRAATQIARAAQWWEDNRPAASGAVATDLAECFALLQLQPGIGTRIAEGRDPLVRRLYLGRVGYFVYYKVVGAELRVLAFWHASRAAQPKL